MKYIKILVFVMALAGFAACHSDDKPEYNSNKDVTVSMEVADTTYLETDGLVKVPFEVKGKRNGYITLTCQVSEFSPVVAMEDVHYMVTDYTVNVDTMDNSGYFEVKLVDDDDENKDRAFQISIVSVEGATVSGIQTTIVTILDNDSDPYLRLAGKWKAIGEDLNGTPNERIVSVLASRPGMPGFYSSYNVVGLLVDDEPLSIKANFIYNEEKDEGEIQIPYGQPLPDYSEDGVTYTGKLSYAYYSDGGLYAGTTSGEASYTWSEDHHTLYLLSWPGANDVPFPGACFGYLIYNGSRPASIFDAINNVSTFEKVLNK